MEDPAQRVQRPAVELTSESTHNNSFRGILSRRISAPFIEYYETRECGCVCMLLLIVGSMVALFLLMHFYN